MIENFVKFGHVVYETCERTNKQTDTILRNPHLHLPRNVRPRGGEQTAAANSSTFVVVRCWISASITFTALTFVVTISTKTTFPLMKILLEVYSRYVSTTRPELHIYSDIY